MLTFFLLLVCSEPSDVGGVIEEREGLLDGRKMRAKVVHGVDVFRPLVLCLGAPAEKQ